MSELALAEPVAGPYVLAHEGPGDRLSPTAAALAFVDAAANAILTTLTAGRREFGLMPYRLRQNEFLGFDWTDQGEGSISFTFWVESRPRHLPTTIDASGADIGVADLTDALLLVRLIAMRVQGNSVGVV